MSEAYAAAHRNRRRLAAGRSHAVLHRLLAAGVLALITLTSVTTAQAGSRPVGARSDLHELGARSRSLPATGYFTTVHEHGRWYFVTPTGQLFFSTGVDHVASALDIDQTTGRCPYCETIQSQYPSTAAWETATVAQLRSWGFNSLGPFSDVGEFGSLMPYSVQLSMASGTDWFASSFVTNADQVAATQVAPLANDPDLIGWYTDSELTWGPDIQNTNTELQDYLALPAGSPGLAVAQQYVGRPAAFLYALATRYFQVTTAAIRMYDAHHLILGVKAEGQYIYPQLLEAASHYVNVFSIDDYALQPGYAAIIQNLWGYLPVTPTLGAFEKYAKVPLMVGEYSFIGATSQTPDTVPGVYATFPTQKDRALAYTDYIAPLYLRAPWVVGDEWFEYVDEPQGGRVGDGENNNFGLVNVQNQPYTELVTQTELLHSIAPDRVVNSGSACDAWVNEGGTVVCSATMLEQSYPLAVVGTTLPEGFRGDSYHEYVLAEGGRPRYTYSVQQNSLPPGLHLNATSGEITGRPQALGSYAVTVEVTDASTSSPQHVTAMLSLDVASP